MSSYLHDAYFSWTTFSLIVDHGTLSLDVERPRHERPVRGKLFGLIPVIDYEGVTARLVVSAVKQVRVDPARREDNAYLPFSSSEVDGMTPRLLFEGADLYIELDRFEPVVLRDVGEPTGRVVLRDFGSRSMYDRLAAEIQARSAADDRAES
jgi:hypothetical protein